MISLTKRIIRQIGKDKRTVALVVVAPMLILTLLSLLLGNTSYTPTIATNNLPPAITEELNKQNINLIKITDTSNPKQYLKDNKTVDAIFFLSETGPVIVMYESGIKSGTAMKAIQNTLFSLNPSWQLQTTFVIGNSDESLFESMGYIFFGIIAFFLIFIVSGMSIVKERSNGTLERMMMSPITRRGVAFGYTAGYGLFATIQACVLVFFSIYVLGLHSVGNIGWIILIMLLLAIAAVAFGELISIFTDTELQVVQLIPIAIIPQIFFSGLIPLDTIPYHLGNLCYIMPIYYGCTAIKEIMILGNGFMAIWPFILALLAYISVLTVLNTLALKKYRKI